MVVLTDDQANPVLQPTKQNILRAMNWLVSNAQPNDALFLHYSGMWQRILERVGTMKKLILTSWILQDTVVRHPISMATNRMARTK